MRGGSRAIVRGDEPRPADRAEAAHQRRLDRPGRAPADDPPERIGTVNASSAGAAGGWALGGRPARSGRLPRTPAPDPGGPVRGGRKASMGIGSARGPRGVPRGRGLAVKKWAESVRAGPAVPTGVRGRPRAPLLVLPEADPDPAQRPHAAPVQDAGARFQDIHEDQSRRRGVPSPTSSGPSFEPWAAHDRAVGTLEGGHQRAGGARAHDCHGPRSASGLAARWFLSAHAASPLVRSSTGRRSPGSSRR